MSLRLHRSAFPAVSHDTHPNLRFIQMRLSARCVGLLTWTSTTSWKSITHTLTHSHGHTNNLCCSAEVHCSVRIITLHSGGQSAFYCVQTTGELQGLQQVSTASRLWTHQVEHLPTCSQNNSVFFQRRTTSECVRVSV